MSGNVKVGSKNDRKSCVGGQMRRVSIVHWVITRFANGLAPVTIRSVVDLQGYNIW